MEEIRITDYLERKLTNKAIFDATAGATEQDKFDTLANDSSRLEAITYNNISGAVAVPFLMTQNSIDSGTATLMLGSIQLQSIEDNAAACKTRYDNKAKGWWAILFTYFDISTALAIKEDARNYLTDYIDSALFGTQYGDSENGLLDFINNTGTVLISLEDYTLLSGTDYTAVQTALTTYFYE